MKTVEHLGYKYKIEVHAGKPKVFRWSSDRYEWILSLSFSVDSIEHLIKTADVKAYKKELARSDKKESNEVVVWLKDVAKAKERKALAEKALKCRANGLMLREIASQLDISSSHASQLIKELNGGKL